MSHAHTDRLSTLYWCQSGRIAPFCPLHQHFITRLENIGDSVWCSQLLCAVAFEAQEAHRRILMFLLPSADQMSSFSGLSTMGPLLQDLENTIEGSTSLRCSFQTSRNKANNRLPFSLHDKLLRFLQKCISFARLRNDHTQQCLLQSRRHALCPFHLTGVYMQQQ